MNTQLEQSLAPGAAGQIKESGCPRVLMAATIGISVRGGLTPYSRYFRSLGWTVDGMANGIKDFPECAESFDRIWNVSWSRNPLARVNLSRAVSEVRAAVHERQYDIVHVHTPVAAFVMRFALRGMRGKRPVVIYTAHGFHFYPGGNPVKNLAFRLLERKAARWTDYIVVINHTDQAACREYRIAPRKAVRYMPGIGIDTRRFSKAAKTDATTQRVRDELGVPSEAKLFLMVAEFQPGKRHVDALQALSYLQRRDIYLVFAGQGRKLDEIRTLATRLGLQSQVRFLGFRRDVDTLMEASTALLLPSNREGLPLCILEAMSIALPVIATNIRGSSDLIGNGCGHLVPHSNPKALAAAIAHVADHQGEARKMAQAAAQSVAQYDLENLKRLHHDLYREALAE